MRSSLCGAPLGFLHLIPSHFSESVKTPKYEYKSDFIEYHDHSDNFALCFSQKYLKTIVCVNVYFHQKLPNPVFSRLLKEVERRDEFIRQHLSQYKV